MKVHQMLVQEIVRNLEFRKEFLAELEKFAEFTIEFRVEKIKDDPIVLDQTFHTITKADFESDAPAAVDVGEGYIRVRDGELIIAGDQFISLICGDWINCISMIGNPVGPSYPIRRPYRPIHGWRMQEGWRELSSQETIQIGDMYNYIGNGMHSQDGWTDASDSFGKKLTEIGDMVVRRRVA